MGGNEVENFDFIDSSIKIEFMTKISIRFFDNKEVRAVWDEENSKWWFSVVDIVAVLNEQNDYTKANNYWRWLKRKLIKEQNQLVSATHGFKLVAADGKKRLADMLITKYVEMNVAHPFMEGNGRSTRIWLDLMLKRTLKKCVDWSKINKNDYLSAMAESVIDSTRIKSFIEKALTNKINDREMFMKGIDYSYYYEEG